MFKKYIKQLTAAKTMEEIRETLYQADQSFQHEKLSWDDHEIIFSLATRLENELIYKSQNGTN